MKKKAFLQLESGAQAINSAVANAENNHGLDPSRLMIGDHQLISHSVCECKLGYCWLGKFYFLL